MVGGAGGVGAASGGCHELRKGLGFGSRAGRRAGAGGWREAVLIVYLGIVYSQYGAFGSLHVLAGWPVCGSGLLLGLLVVGVWAASSVMRSVAGRWKAEFQAVFGHPGARSAGAAVPSAGAVRIARSRWHVGMRTVEK